MKDRLECERFAESLKGGQFQRLFNFLPGVYFVAKNLKGRVMMANRFAVELCGMPNEACMLGKTDYDLFPDEQAEQYVADDQHVLKTGEPVVDRIELAPDPKNAINWFITTKLPLYDHDGKIIGLACIARSLDEDSEKIRPFVEMNEVLDYIRNQYAAPIKADDLAAIMNLSAGQFERNFKKTFGITPKQHILNVRLRAACRLLRSTHDTIASIALDAGFYDHSHFSRCFKKEMGISPSEYRCK